MFYAPLPVGNKFCRKNHLCEVVIVQLTNLDYDAASANQISRGEICNQPGFYTSLFLPLSLFSFSASLRTALWLPIVNSLDEMGIKKPAPIPGLVLRLLLLLDFICPFVGNCFCCVTATQAKCQRQCYSNTTHGEAKCHIHNVVRQAHSAQAHCQH
jgi:hypothetical protein